MLRSINNYKQTWLLAFLNIGLFFLLLFLSKWDSNIPLYFSAWKFQTGLFAPYQLITYQFIHSDLTHLYFNMLTLLPVSVYLEPSIKSPKLFWYFLLCGIISGALHLIFYNENLPLVGASGSIWGLSVLLALTRQSKVLKILVFGLFFLEIWKYFTIESSQVAHLCHIGGGIAGFLIYFFEKKSW